MILVTTDDLKSLILSNPPEVYRHQMRQEADRLRWLSEKMDSIVEFCDDPMSTPVMIITMLDYLNK